MKPLVSVVIPTYNGWEFLRPCLESIRQQTYQPAEVIVVDNGSHDGTRTRLAQGWPNVTTIPLSQNEGFALACNRGIHAARAPWVLLLNNDTRLAPECLDRLVRAVEQEAPQVAFAYGKLWVLGQNRMFDQVGSEFTWTGFLDHVGLFEPDRGQFDQPQEPATFPKGVSVLLRREAFDAVGGFDEAFFAYFEETDLFWRLRLAGYEGRYVPEAITHHHIGGTYAKLPAAMMDFHAYKNRIRALIKNLSARHLWILPMHLACCLAMATLHLGRGHARSAWAIVRAIAWNLRVAPQTWAVRSWIQRSLRRRSDQEVLGALGWRIPIGRFGRMVWWTLFARPAQGRLRIRALDAREVVR